MPLKPKNNKPGSWLGHQEVAVIEIEDKRQTSEKLATLDVALSVKLAVKGSEYPNYLQIFGTFKREEDNPDNIIDCPLLKGINYLCEALDFEGGVDINGNWVDKDDNPIEDIVKHLNDNYVKVSFPETEYNHCAYMYQEKNPKDGKVYTRVFKKIVKKEDFKDFENYIAFCINKRYLVEYEETPSYQVTGQTGDGLVSS